MQTVGCHRMQKTTGVLGLAILQIQNENDSWDWVIWPVLLPEKANEHQQGPHWATAWQDLLPLPKSIKKSIFLFNATSFPLSNCHLKTDIDRGSPSRDPCLSGTGCLLLRAAKPSKSCCSDQMQFLDAWL